MEGQTLTICPNCPNEERVRIGHVSTGEPPSSLSLIAASFAKHSIVLTKGLSNRHLAGEMIVQGVFPDSSTTTEASLAFNSEVPTAPAFTNATIKETRMATTSIVKAEPPPMQALSLPILSQHARDIISLFAQLRNKTVEILSLTTNVEQVVTSQQEDNERIREQFSNLVGGAYNSSVEGAMEDAATLKGSDKLESDALSSFPSSTAGATFAGSLSKGASVQLSSTTSPLVAQSPTLESSPKKRVAVSIPDASVNNAPADPPKVARVPIPSRFRLVKGNDHTTELMQLSARTAEMGALTELMQLPSPPPHLVNIGIKKLDEKLYNASFEDNAYETSMDVLEAHMGDWMSVQNDFPKAHARVESMIQQLKGIQKVKEEELHLVATLLVAHKALQAKFKKASYEVSNTTTIVDRPKDAQNMPANPWLEQWYPGCNPSDDGCNASAIPSPVPQQRRKTTTYKDRRTGALKKRYGSINDAMNDLGGEEVIAPPPDISQLFSQLASKAQVAKAVMAEATHFLSPSGSVGVDSMPESKNSKVEAKKDMFNPNTRVSKIFHKSAAAYSA